MADGTLAEIDGRSELTDFPALMKRLHDGTGEAVEGLLADLCAEVADGDAALWQAFFSERAHIFRRADEHWPAHKILLQLAMEHGDDSPVTKAAEAWVEAGACDWLWFRDAERPAKALPSPCLRVFETESMGNCQDAVALGRDRIFSWDYSHLRYWDRSSGRCLAKMEVPQDGIAQCLAHESGVAVSWAKQEFHAWDLETGKKIGDLVGHADEVNRALFLPDGRLVSWANDKCARIWDVRSLKCLATLHQGGVSMFRAMLLPDGRLATWGGSDDVRFWDLETGDGINNGRLRGNENSLMTEFIPLTGGGFTGWESWNGALMHWETGEDGERPREYKMPEKMGSLDGECRLHPDGLAVVWLCLRHDEKGGGSRPVHVWNFKKGGYVGALSGHEGTVLDVAFLPGGDLLTCGRDRTLRVWDGESLACRHVLKGHKGPVTGALILDGERVLSRGRDGTMRLWNINSGECLKVFPTATRITGARALEDGTVLAWSDDGDVTLWDLSLEPLPLSPQHTGFAVSETFKLDEQRLVATYSNVPGAKLWDVTKGALLNSFEANGESNYLTRPLSDGRILFLDEKGGICVWDPETGESASFPGRWEVLSYRLVVLSEGRFAWCGDGGEVYVWSGRAGDRPIILEGHEKKAEGVLELPGGRLLTWGAEPDLRIWNLDIREGRKQSKRGTGKVAVLQKAEGQLDKGHCEHVLQGHAEEVRGAALAPDGVLLTWARDGCVGVWDQETGTALNFFRVSEHIFDMIDQALGMPDGSIVTQAGFSNPPKVWSRNSGVLLAAFQEKISCYGMRSIGPDRLVVDGGDGTFLLEPSTGSVIDQCEGVECLSRRPDLLATREDVADPGYMSNGFLCWSNRGRCGFSPAREDGGIWAAWLMESMTWTTPSLFADGTMVMGGQDGRLHRLHLYRGGERLRLDTLAEELPPLEQAIPEGAVIVRRSGDKGFVLEAGPIVRAMSRRQMEAMKDEIAKALASDTDEEERIDAVAIKRQLSQIASMKNLALQKWLKLISKDDLAIAMAAAYEDDAFCEKICSNISWKAARILHLDADLIRRRDDLEWSEIKAAVSRLVDAMER